MDALAAAAVKMGSRPFGPHTQGSVEEPLTHSGTFGTQQQHVAFSVFPILTSANVSLGPGFLNLHNNNNN